MLVRRTLVIILSVAGIGGFLLGALDLARAITLCQALYSVDAVSLEIVSDLEDDMEGSRRALLGALVSDVNRRGSEMDESSAAGNRVRASLRHLRSLDPPDVLRQVDQFERSWYDYERVAGRILQLSGVGDRAMATQMELAVGQLSFSSALVNLRTLKQQLAEHAKIDSTIVDKTLKHSIWGFAEFGVSLLIILLALGQAYRDRRKALVALKSTNDALAAAKIVEQQRAAILKWSAPIRL